MFNLTLVWAGGEKVDAGEFLQLACGAKMYPAKEGQEEGEKGGIWWKRVRKKKSSNFLRPPEK